MRRSPTIQHALACACIVLVALATIASGESSGSDSIFYPAQLREGTRTIQSPVYKLNAQQFQQMKEKKNYAFLVQFYHPLSLAARPIEKEWTDAAKSLQGFMPLAVVDCEVEQSLCSSQRVNQASPEIRFYKANDPDYGGERGGTFTQANEAKALVAFALLQLRNPTELLDNSNFYSVRSKLLEKKHVSIILFSDKRSTPSIFKSLASNFADDFIFIEVRTTGKPSDKIIEAYDVKRFPTMVFQIGENGTKHVYTGEWSDIFAMKKWILNQANPLARALDRTAKEYTIKTESLFPSWVPHFGIPPPQPEPVKPTQPPPKVNAQPGAPVPAASQPGRKDEPAAAAKKEVPKEEAAAPATEPAVTAVSELPELSDQSCFDRYCGLSGDANHHLLCAVLVVYPSRTDAQLIKRDKALMKTMEGRDTKKIYNFVWVNGDLQSHWLTTSFGISSSSHSHLVLVNGPKRSFVKYTPPQVNGAPQTGGGPENLGDIEEFLTKVYQNRIPYTLQAKEHGSGGYASLTTGTIHCPHVERALMPDGDKSVEELNKRSTNAQQGDEGQMMYITSGNFQSLVSSSHQAWLLLFCNRMEKAACEIALAAFMNAARQLKNQVKFGFIQTSQESDLARQYSIHSVPTIRYFGQQSPKSPATVHPWTGPTQGAHMEQALVAHAWGLLDAKLVPQVTSTSFTKWLTYGADETARIPDSSPLRVIFFASSATEVPSYLKALSYRYRGEVVFGVSTHTETALVTRFGVTQIPALYIFSTPKNTQFTEEQQRDPSLIPFEPKKYTVVLTFNQLELHLEQVLSTEKATNGAGATANPTPTENRHDEL